MNEDSVIRLASKFSVQETVDRLASNVESNGFMVFARIDHAAHAAKIGMELRPRNFLFSATRRLALH